MNATHEGQDAADVLGPCDKSLRVARRCPRCKAYRHHLANVDTRQTHCVECAHAWRLTRLSKDEREDFLQARIEWAHQQTVYWADRQAVYAEMES